MIAWNQDRCIEAWNFACVAHRVQLVPGTEVAYSNHIGLVAMEAMMAIATSDDIARPDLLVLCALLHDTVEDTDVTVQDLENKFGSDVSRGVSALTKNKNLPDKAEQMSDSIERIKEQPKEVWMVKLCDRITNLQPPPAYWEKAQITNYKREASGIHEALGESNLYLSERLRQKIQHYEKFE